MGFPKRAAWILLVFLVSLGLAASGRAHEAFHSHPGHHQGCQVCILGGTTPPPPPRPENPRPVRRQPLPSLRSVLPMGDPPFRLGSRAPPSSPPS